MQCKHSALISVLLISALACSCSTDDKSTKKTTGKAREIAMADEGFYGWDSLTLHAPYSRIDVVPELGGKIMGYELRGFQILWHDPVDEGKLYENEGYGYGESFFNPGGAKVWPAPQGWSGPGEWPGPPDNVLDGSPYEVVSDDKSITVTSPSDTGEGRSGLRLEHTYSLRSSSSIADLNLSMTNVVDRPVAWSLWHLATVPVNREATVYVPVNKGNWHVMFGDKDNPQWLGVENGLFRAKYDKRIGKVGLKAREGWVAWHDEENDVVFTIKFPVKKGADYPDGGSNVEIWTAGEGTITVNNEEIHSEYKAETAMMELEVLGPMTRLNPNDSSSLDVTWAACRCTGVVDVRSHGVVAQKPVIEDGMIKAKFGVFYGGYFMIEYIDKNGNRKGLKNFMEISPLSEVVVNQEVEYFSSFSDGVRYYVQPYGQKEMGLLGEIMVK